MHTAVNPYEGRGQLEHAWDYGWHGYPCNQAWKDASIRAYREGQAMRATLALTESRTVLRHPHVKTGVVR